MPKQGDILTLGLVTADTAAQLSSDEALFFDDVNIHVYGGTVYYGNGDAVVRATQGAGTPDCSTALNTSILSFRNCRISTLWFKSFTAATPARIYATGTIMNAPS
jgi:hypothetical protein